MKRDSVLVLLFLLLQLLPGTAETPPANKIYLFGSTTNKAAFEKAEKILDKNKITYTTTIDKGHYEILMEDSQLAPADAAFNKALESNSDSDLWYFGQVSYIHEATPEKFFGGQDNLRVVMSAKIITVFRITDSEPKAKSEIPGTIDGYICDKNSVVLGDPEAARVIDALSDMHNFGVEYACDFDPGVIIRFGTKARHVDIVVCFVCGEMLIFSNGIVVKRPFQWARSLNSLHGIPYQAFVAAAKKAFPNDPQIIALKD